MAALTALATQQTQGHGTNPSLSIRVLEKHALQELRVQSPSDVGKWNEVKLSRGQIWVNGKAQKEASWGTLDSTIKIKTGDFTRIYPGSVHISVVNGNSLLILNQVPLEEYVACVTAFESGHDRSQPEYLKALGAVVRAYALSHRKRHPNYDLCDLSHCQVYQGMPPTFGFWKKMAEAGQDYSWPTGTDPKLLFFHRCCGGALESSEQIWGGSPSPNRVGPDELDGKVLCREDGFFHWNSTAPIQDLGEVLAGIGGLLPHSRMTDLKIVERTTGGRAKTFLAFFYLPDGQTREVKVNAPRFFSEFGKRHGWRVFPSSWFEMQREGDLYKFSGKGFGHGVGLCQSGALKLAQLGWDWKKILGFYFPGR